MSGTDSNINGIYLKPGFYSYEIDSDGYYTLTKYDGTATGDNNRVVDNEAITNIYNNMITTASVLDLNAADASIVDLTGYGLTTLDQINDYIKDGYTVTVSFWSYLYDYYYSTYGSGNTYAKTTTIYINSISK
jgi:hypothetical protein